MNDVRRIIFFIFFILLANQLLFAQDISQSKNNKSDGNGLDSVRTAKLKLGRPLFTPFIAPSYSPELEFLLSAGGLYSFKSQKENSSLQRSSIPFSVGYSTNGSLQISAKLFYYGKQDNFRVFSEFWLKDMPDHYWGVGYENGKNREISDSTTAYQRHWWKLYNKVVWRIGSNTFAGAILDMNRTKASELNPIMEEDPAVQVYGTDIRNSGLGFAVQYDSRDVIVNAYRGWYLDLSTVFYGKFLGGNHKYQYVELDYRQYLSLGKPRQTLAWQVKTRLSFGAVPWPELSQLGTPFDLRGYRWGRYRDRDMLFGLLEYRQMFNRKRPNKKGSLKSKSGFVTWVGTGTVSKGIGELNWLPNFGVGYRFEVQPRMNVRVDYGFGSDTNALYITFNEAF